MKKAIAMDQSAPESLLAGGLFAEYTGKETLALMRYQRLVRIDPKSAEGFFYLGRLLSRSAGKEAAAREALETAQNLDSGGVWGVRAQAILSGEN